MAVSFRIPAFAACSLLLAACAGGHGSGEFTPAALPQSDAAFEPGAGAQTVPMKYSIKIPPAKPNASGALLHEQFVSASTQSIAFAVYKAGSKHGAKTLLFTKVIALNAGAKGCTGAKTRTCSGTLKLPPPAVDIVATTYDLKPAGKKISKKAKALAVATIAGQAVVANKKIAITLGGIPASFTMTIPGSTIVNGVQTASVYGMSQSSSNISVKAFDVDGNFIVSDGYVDAAGKSTGIAMSEKPSWASCTTPVLQDGTATPGASIVVTAPPKDGVFFNYGIGGIAAPFSTAGYCSFAVSARLGKGPIQKGSYVLDGPQLNEYPISSTSAPTGIVVGPDNNIWFVDGASVGTVNVATKTIAPEVPVGSAAAIASYAGSLWINGYGHLVQMSTAGAILNDFTETTATSPNQQMAIGPDGNFWFTETQAQKVAKVSLTGTATEYPVDGKVYPVGMTSAAGNLWFTGCVGQKIASISTAGTQKQYVVPNTPYGQPAPFFMVTGPDGNLWFTSCGGGTISRMSVPAGGALKPSVFRAPSTSSLGRGQLWGLAAGPNADMWMADIQGYLDRIPLTANDASQMSQVKVSAAPQWMTTGPDGAIWFTEYTLSGGNGMIGRLVP
jgi:virginiamycin B lyase